ncbi:MAG: Dipeptide-binding ABC transporter, periplasmic substrate-binding component [uncultured Acidimicrobiales bacterium]|uniref:Dipeptide-binding ABC transporter, periplasmic substrate-binding component n=1 Tax=uncultured Acidimicrobiales bacterium TaxID=310071 RepID=A0A6J4HZ83_9ACTN|nr:MAG: Dipeptide-binding ABC transporter, periplasmic substrate-binding component [uncultured Acidimicrobiales bacterium]
MALVACGGGDDTDDAGAENDPGTEAGVATTEPSDEGEPTRGGDISVGLIAESTSLRPGTGTFNLNIGYAIMDPLMVQTAERTVEPYLAESLVPNEDLTEYTLTLREGVTFHDGTPLDAEAIKSNFDTYLKASTSTLQGALRYVTSFDVTGELTGVYKLSQSSAAFPDVLVTPAGMPFSPTAAEAKGDAYIDSPVGTGPFTFVSWTKDNNLVVERNEDYWQEGLPYLDRITFRPLTDEESRYSSLVAGDLDAIASQREHIVARALADEEQDILKTSVFVGNSAGGSVINTLVPPVDDPRVRRGLAHAINQDDVITVMSGTGITPPMTQFFGAESPYYSEAVAAAWPAYDTEAARASLQEYIDDPSRSDGKAPGSPVSIEYQCGVDPAQRERSQVYQAMWSDVGVDVTLSTIEVTQYITDVIGTADTDPPFAGEYMINCWTFGSEADPFTTFDNTFGPVPTQANNTSNYTSATLDEQIQILGSSDDIEVRKAAVEAIGMELAEQVPNVFAGSSVFMIATNPSLNNVNGWTLPDGTPGSGQTAMVTHWSQVWQSE